jgi:hypothetical protein
MTRFPSAPGLASSDRRGKPLNGSGASFSGSVSSSPTLYTHQLRSFVEEFACWPYSPAPIEHPFDTGNLMKSNYLGCTNEAAVHA